MSMKEDINFWQNKLNTEKERRFEIQKQKDLKKKKNDLRKEYLQLKFKEPLSIGKTLVSGFRGIGRGVMTGVKDIQKYNGRKIKK